MSAPRILIVRLSAIGDVLHGVPTACALRRQFPDAFLGWVVEGRTGELLRGHAALDEVIVVPRGWLKSAKTVLKLRKQLRAFRFDTAIDLQGLSKSAVAAWLSGASQRISYGGVDGRELSPWLNNQLIEPQTTHVITRALELLQPLGIIDPSVEFNMPRSPAAEEAADRMIASAGLTGSFAVLNPGAGWQSKLWPAERFGAVARHLGRDHGLSGLVVWAGAQEKLWAETIVACSGGEARLAPPTSLVELAAILRRARMFVGSDTGPLHLAAAVGTASVGLFGPVSEKRNGPYGEQNITVQKMLLTGSSRERRQAGPESMLAIRIEDVTAACDRLLSRHAMAA
jgi:lipopolysaccharide heptosyltransferase I